MGAGHGISGHELCPRGNENSLHCKMMLKKSRIRATKHLSTDADCSTDTTVGWTKNTQQPKFFEKRKKSSETQKLKNVKRYANISDIPFDQRSLIHGEAWFPPCFERQNQQKKLKKNCAVILDHFQTKMFKCETTSFHCFSPRILNLQKYWTSDF